MRFSEGACYSSSQPNIFSSQATVELIMLIMLLLLGRCPTFLSCLWWWRSLWWRCSFLSLRSRFAFRSLWCDDDECFRSFLSLHS